MVNFARGLPQCARAKAYTPCLHVYSLSQVCAARTEICTLIWAPVCGCNNETFASPCSAAASGVSVSYYGECARSNCTNNTQCKSDEFCTPGEFLFAY
jgi:hypothetical protein